MLILAIDTALDACAAGVLDTEAGRLIAQESQAMKRGHAEALMPLIARVIKASGVAFAALDRIAVTTGPGSFTGLRVGLSAARGIALAANKPVVGLTTLTAYAAAVVAQNLAQPVISAIDARHDQVYFQVVSGDGGSLIPPCVGPIEEALGASRLARRIWSATPPRFSPTAGRPMRRHLSRSIRNRHRILAGWAGLEPRSIRTPRRPGRFTCARQCQTARRSAVEGLAALSTMMAWLTELWSGGTPAIDPRPCATRRSWRNCMAHRFTADGAKPNLRPC